MHAYLIQVLFENTFSIADLINSLGELQVDSDLLLLDVLFSLLEDSSDDPSEGAGGIALLLCLQDVLIRE